MGAMAETEEGIAGYVSFLSPRSGAACEIEKHPLELTIASRGLGGGCWTPPLLMIPLEMM